MKYLHKLFIATCLASICIFPIHFSHAQDHLLPGTWVRIQPMQPNIQCIMLFGDRVYMKACFDTTHHQLLFAEAGRYEWAADTLYGNEVCQYPKPATKRSFAYPVVSKPDQISFTDDQGNTQIWKKLPESITSFTGTWRIIQHQQNGQLRDLPQTGDRKTLKLLAGSHFQWAALNLANGQIYATGGGRYTLQDGKYIEHIEFFSRDSTRVGMSLPFDDEIKGDLWYHKGKTTQGTPNYEVWKRVEE